MKKIAFVCLKAELTIDVFVWSGNRLQMDAQIFLRGKKKLPGKRITGVQVAISYPIPFQKARFIWITSFLGKSLPILCWLYSFPQTTQPK